MTAIFDREFRVPFADIDWAHDVPGITAKEAEQDGRRWAVVEYEKGSRREEWCLDGHVGYVLKGSVQYEFEDGGEPLTVSGGEGFSLSTGRAHRGRNLADGASQLFLIDDPHSD